MTMLNRWARINGATVHVVLPMTRQDIADYIGLSIETVSRTFTSLVKQKLLVIVPDGVRLTDVVRLETIAAT